MSNNSKDPFAGWGWLGAIIGGLYGYALNENSGEAIGYAIFSYGTGWLVGFVVNTFLAWLIITIVLLIAISALRARLDLFAANIIYEQRQDQDCILKKLNVLENKEIFFPSEPSIISTRNQMRNMPIVN